MAERQHILLIDDDVRLRLLLRRYLTEYGYFVSDFGLAKEGIRFCDLFSPDAIILDIMLPDMDGNVFARQLMGKDPRHAIVMLSALGRVQDRIKGLKSGAVEYLPKPFDPEELLLRIKIAMASRRSMNRVSPYVNATGLKAGQMQDVLETYGKQITLTDHEARLLAVFSGQAGHVLSRPALAHMCQLNGSDRSVDVLVLRLRRKLASLTGISPEIKTVRGHGYMFFRNDAQN